MLLLISLLPNMNSLLPQLINSYGNIVYLGLFALIFVETGIVIMPWLPGDSLLFLCGSLAALASGSLNIWWLLMLLIIAAILGDSLNFEIGEHFGARIAASPRIQQFIKPKYLARSAQFFARHGKAAIFLGRFIPIIRTFIPFTAGISQMHYRDFITHNILGGCTWVAIGLGSGYFFGNIPLIKTHFELIMIAIVFISLLPAIIMVSRQRGARTDAD